MTSLEAQYWSRYGVTSTADLNVGQLDELIRKYSADYNKPATDEIRKLRSQVMILLGRIGVYQNENDWYKVNRYLMDKRIAGKLLYQMKDESELQALIRKLRAIADKKEEQEIEEFRKAQLN